MDFWGGFTTIGFLLFIFGIPIAVIGAIINERINIKFQKSIIYFLEKQQNYNSSQSIHQQVKTLFCPNCGIKLDSYPAFCYNCGYKLR